MLIDCIVKEPTLTEVFFVQKGRASIVVKAVRDRLTQALLPIDSSFPIVARSSFEDLLGDRQVKNILATLGVGISVEGCPLRLECLRYGKIILVTDLTPKGRHIRNEVLALFQRLMPELLISGVVYTATRERWVGITEEEFLASVMSPETSHSDQVCSDCSKNDCG